MNWYKKYFLFVALIVSIPFFSQKKEISEIDKLLELNQEYSWIDRMKALHYAKKASLIAERINNSEKKAYSYVYMAKTLGFLGMNKESFEYLEKVKKEEFLSEDLVLQALIKEEKSVNFGKLGLYSEVLKENTDILKLLKNENSPLAARIMFRAYGNIAANYMNIGDYKMAVKSMALFEAYSKEPLLLKTKHIKGAFSNLYANKGSIYLSFYKNRDSALYYFNKALEIVKNDPKESKSTPYIALGDYYNDQKQYAKALNFYLKAIDDLESRKLDILDLRLNLYDKTAKIYSILGQTGNEKKCLDKYNIENEKILARNPENLQMAVDTILSEKEKNTLKQTNFIVALSVILIIIIIFSSIIIYRNRVKRKLDIIEEKENRLSVKRDIISQKEAETKELKIKLNGNIEGLFELAKNNHPNFYHRFLEVHSNFETKLIQITPLIQRSEFVLLAYIYMNFDTKDIAEITYKSIRTIQNKKYNLRKKLGISTQDDFYIWMKENC